MTGPAPVAIGPDAYSAWRSTELGARTERIEQDLLLRLAGDVAGRRLLDAGCGDGALAALFAARGARVVGVDADVRMLAAAAARTRAAGVEIALVAGAVERLPFSAGSFDVVAAVTVLCFIRDPGRAIVEMARVLAPGGVLVIGELNRWSVWALRRRIRGWLGAPSWRRAHFTDARALRRLLAGAGFETESVEGGVFYPPSGLVARIMAPVEARRRRRTTFGAAFVAVRARKSARSRAKR